MKIILVEDDADQILELELELHAQYPDAELEIIDSEYKFRSQRDRIAAESPAVVIMDVMLRWSDAAPEVPEAPEEVMRDRFFRAGFRCLRELHAKNPRIPVILFSVIDREDLTELSDLARNVRYVRKESSADNLFTAIREVRPRKRSRKRSRT